MKEILKAGDVMTKKVITVTKEMPVYDAIKILLDNKISGAPVTKEVDGNNQLIGIISEAALSFIVHEPSGIILVVKDRSFISKRCK